MISNQLLCCIAQYSGHSESETVTYSFYVENLNINGKLLLEGCKLKVAGYVVQYVVFFFHFFRMNSFLQGLTAKMLALHCHFKRISTSV